MTIPHTVIRVDTGGINTHSKPRLSGIIRAKPDLPLNSMQRTPYIKTKIFYGKMNGGFLFYGMELGKTKPGNQYKTKKPDGFLHNPF
jgi:hypothetical protein